MEKKNVKILIVDDHPIVRDGIKTMLEMGDFDCCVFNILEAGNGEETMTMLKNNAFDLVIMDYQLEETDGSSLAKRVIESYPEQHILALSNYDDIEYAGNMLKAGARGYVMKNVGTKELIKAINTVLEGKLYYAQHLANELIERRILGKGSIDLASDNPAVARLSRREVEIIQLICDQLTNEEISKKLFLSKRTIDNHRQNILNKLGMNNTAGLVRFAVENGLVS
ncbi:MAG: Transcriptional regulatory protein DegU [Cryomorphaceae bacterium]|jgi:DNA-binding NarL/FixJ family response regulator|nr:MAG: Transcriptional regulatory protein DegU [Cryomorphaceae bacterium]